MRTAPDIIFPGVRPPTSDFQAVRDGRRALPFNFPVPLGAARSLANGKTEDPTDASGKALAIQMAGNVFFSDPLFDLAGNSIAGIARVHFQDTANAQSPYLTVLPTAVYRIPFTELLVENHAQAGKFLQIVYGTDIDINPGTSSQVQATLLNSLLNVDDVGDVTDAAAGQTFIGFQTVAPAPALVNQSQLFNPAASGIVLYVDTVRLVNFTSADSLVLCQQNAQLSGGGAVSNGFNKNFGGAASAAQLKSQTPGGFTGNVIDERRANTPGTEVVWDFKAKPLRLPPGWGVHVTANVVNSSTFASFEWREKVG